MIVKFLKTAGFENVILQLVFDFGCLHIFPILNKIDITFKNGKLMMGTNAAFFSAGMDENHHFFPFNFNYLL
jgi:hypothetical protein